MTDLTETLADIRVRAEASTVLEHRHGGWSLGNLNAACASQADVPWLLAAVEAVLELHKPEPAAGGGDKLLCSHCIDTEPRASWYPCPTVRAIQGVMA